MSWIASSACTMHVCRALYVCVVSLPDLRIGTIAPSPSPTNSSRQITAQTRSRTRYLARTHAHTPTHTHPRTNASTVELPRNTVPVPVVPSSPDPVHANFPARKPDTQTVHRHCLAETTPASARLAFSRADNKRVLSLPVHQTGRACNAETLLSAAE
jgi:hypothetical protein